MARHWSWVPVPCHTAEVNEIIRVLWSDHYGAALFGDEDEIACLPYRGCRLEILKTAESGRPEVNFVLPGQALRYKGRFCFHHRLELPSGASVGLWDLVGFKLRLAPNRPAPVPSEDDILDRERRAREQAGVK